ncbi:MAG: hypothetical protein LBH44_07425 [Treponema sp.]|jgi:hypothetical protein|nr:hypothetical protein [Treponema sp.]
MKFMMDIAEFLIEKSLEQNGLIINIYINGKKLSDILKEYEKQFDEKIAGKYDGIPLSYFGDIIKHFTGKIDKDMLNYNGKTQLLGCACGEAGCWPFLSKIKTNNNILTWNEYEQPHRKINSSGGYWDYSNLQSFTFNKIDYENNLLRAVETIKMGEK